MNRIKIVFTLALFVIMSGNALVMAHSEDELEFFHPVQITKEKPLTIMDCVSLAYQNSPKIKRQKFNLDIATSNVGIARSGYFPVISAGVGFYNENNSDHVYYNRHYRDLPSVGVSINKMVWDFGKTTANIKMEEFYKIGAEYEFMDSLCSTLFDVKWKYYQFLKAKAMKDISQENIRMQKELVEVMKNKHPDWDNACGVLSGNTLESITSEDAYKNAKVNLSNAMYLSNNVDYNIENTDTFRYEVPQNIEQWKEEYKVHKKHVFDFPRSDAVNIAYKNSPDLKVLIATKKAMKHALKYIKRSYLPELNASVGYGYDKTFEASNNSLRVGVTLDSSVNLMELKHSIAGADAQLNLAQNEIDLFKKDLYYEIQRAFNNLDKAESQLPIARSNVILALNTFNIAMEAYKKGHADYTMVQDAKFDYINSNMVYVEKLYEYNTALIQVEMALHCHIVDIHHKSGHAVHYHSKEIITDIIRALECTMENEKHDNKKFRLFSEENDLDEDL